VVRGYSTALGRKAGLPAPSPDPRATPPE